MLIETYLMFWITCLVFTIASFVWPDRVFFSVMSFVLWASFATLAGDVTYVGTGSLNVIVQSYEYGDPEYSYQFIYVFWGLGMCMLVYAIGTILQNIRGTMNKLSDGEHPDVLGGA